MDTPKDPNKKLGFWMSTSLVVGNMIGAGIFLMPSALAEYGGISILGWIVSAFGAMVLARVFSWLSKMVPRAAGGPYAFARAGFGDFIGFLVAWGYWISIAIANAAIAVTFVGALAILFPILQDSAQAALGLSLAIIWLLTWVNSRGVRSSGKMQVVTTLLKLLPMLALILGGWFYFDWGHFTPFNASGLPSLEAIAITGSMTLYAFLGLESATVPADNVNNPEKTVPRATMIGTLVTTVVYILSSVVVMGMIPPQSLTTSTAPFADAMQLLSGNWGETIVACGIGMATFGALNGWILLQGQIGQATARDGLFPAIFARENKQGAPIYGILMGSLLSSLLVLLNYGAGLVEQFKLLILLATFCNLVPYLFGAAAYVSISLDRLQKGTSLGTVFLWGSLAFAFALWATYGAGETSVYWGFLLLLLGVPVYVLMKSRHKPPPNE